MRAFLLPAICVCLLAGCSSKHYSIVGTWSQLSSSAGTDIGARYNTDGTFESWIHARVLNSTTKGTYKLQGDQLIKTVDESKTPYGAVHNEPTSTFSETLTWTSNDEFQLTTEGAAAPAKYIRQSLA